jgi:hypothetical protein
MKFLRQTVIFSIFDFSHYHTTTAPAFSALESDQPSSNSNELGVIATPKNFTSSSQAAILGLPFPYSCHVASPMPRPTLVGIVNVPAWSSWNLNKPHHCGG